MDESHHHELMTAADAIRQAPAVAVDDKMRKIADEEGWSDEELAWLCAGMRAQVRLGWRGAHVTGHEGTHRFTWLSPSGVKVPGPISYKSAADALFGSIHQVQKWARG